MQFKMVIAFPDTIFEREASANACFPIKLLTENCDPHSAIWLKNLEYTKLTLRLHCFTTVHLAIRPCQAIRFAHERPLQYEYLLNIHSCRDE